MPFAPFAQVDRSVLRWLKTSESPAEFTLLSGDTKVGALRWQDHASAPVRGETADGTWLLERSGFLNPRLLLRTKEGTPEVARVSVHLNYHAIEVTGGARYRFHRAGLLVPAWRITAEDGHELVHLEPAREARKLEGAAVLVSPLGVASPDLWALLALSWYFIVLAWFEDETLIPLEGRDAPADPEKRG